MKKKYYKAIYLPDCKNPNQFNKDGFLTMEEAEKYIFSKRCDACKMYFDPKKYPCSIEWEIQEYKE